MGKLTDRSVNRAQARLRVAKADERIGKLKAKRATLLGQGKSPKSPAVVKVDADLTAARKDRQDANREANPRSRKSRSKSTGGAFLRALAGE